MAKDAESHAAEDRQQRETIETRNRGDAMIYNVEKTLKEHRSKIGDEEARNIEAAIEETRKAMQGNELGVLNAAIDKLTSASHKLAEAMYKSASQPGAGRAQGRPGRRWRSGRGRWRQEERRRCGRRVRGRRRQEIGGQWLVTGGLDKPPATSHQPQVFYVSQAGLLRNAARSQGRQPG